jgi:hypothetical protein
VGGVILSFEKKKKKEALLEKTVSASGLRPEATTGPEAGD